MAPPTSDVSGHQSHPTQYSYTTISLQDGILWDFSALVNVTANLTAPTTDVELPSNSSVKFHNYE